MKKKSRASQVLLIIVLVIAGLIFLMPVYFLLINSLKPLREIVLSFVSLPQHPTFENYAGAMRRIDYVTAFGNTIFLTVGAVAVTMLFSSMCGYKLQRTAGRISKAIYFLFLFGLMVPFTVIMVPMSQLIVGLGIANNLWAIIFVYAAMFMSMTVFIYYNYCKTIPLEMDEAAMIDGCGQTRLFFQIILPLSGTILVSIAVLTALWTWNDFVVALIAITEPELATITRRINNFISQFSGTEWDFFTAAVSLAMVPIMALYIALQKYVQQGILSGAVKG